MRVFDAADTRHLSVAVLSGAAVADQDIGGLVREREQELQDPLRLLVPGRSRRHLDPLRRVVPEVRPQARHRVRQQPRRHARPDRLRPAGRLNVPQGVRRESDIEFSAAAMRCIRDRARRRVNSARTTRSCSRSNAAARESHAFFERQRCHCHDLP